MISKNHKWPNMKSKKVVWSATRGLQLTIIRILVKEVIFFALALNFVKIFEFKIFSGSEFLATDFAIFMDNFCSYFL